jgi:hypothetical protein
LVCLFVLGILLPGSVSAQTPLKDLDKHYKEQGEPVKDGKGNITRKYKAKKNSEAPYRTIQQTTNSNGQVTEEITEDEDGYTCTSVYQADGSATETMTHPKRKGFKKVWKYNSKRHLTQIILTETDAAGGTTVTTTDYVHEPGTGIDFKSDEVVEKKDALGQTTETTRYKYELNKETLKLVRKKFNTKTKEWEEAAMTKEAPEMRAVCHTPTGETLSAIPLFRTGEVQGNFFGLGGVGHGQVNETETQTVTETRTVNETTVVKKTVLKDIPGHPGLTPVDEDVPVTTKHHLTTKEHRSVTRNRAAIQGGFGGMGGEAKVFVTQNIGLGVQGDWLDGESSIGTFFGTVTCRFPIGSNAPYLIGGAGVQFGDRTQAVGELGGGVEHRFSPTMGVFTDVCWMFSNHENAAVFRVGMSIVFGQPGEPLAHTSTETSDTISWHDINPIVKDLH